MNWQPTHPAIQQLIQTLRAEVSQFYLVGGAVRDLLLSPDAHVKDLDFVVPEPAIPVARRVADRLGWAFYPLDYIRQIARILFVDGPRPPFVCDIASMRGDSIEADLAARDFTVNAMALVWSGPNRTILIDECGGRADLERRILRRVSPVSLADDAIRLLRAPRLMAQFDLELEPETATQIMRLARSIGLVSPERVRDELWKALASPRPVFALRQMRRLGLLAHTLPELAATLDAELNQTERVRDEHAGHEWLRVGGKIDDERNESHTLQTVAQAHRLRGWLHGATDQLSGTDEQFDLLARTLAPWQFRLRQLFQTSISGLHTRADWLIWHALFPEEDSRMNTARRAAKSAAAVRLAALRFSRQEISLSDQVTRGRMRPHELHASFLDTHISRRAAYRFYRDVTINQATQMVGFDILLLALCHDQASPRHESPRAGSAKAPRPASPSFFARIAELLAFGFEQIDRPVSQQVPLVDGRLLMQHFNLKPGRHIGTLLELLREAQFAGEITSVEEALNLAADHLDRARTRDHRVGPVDAGIRT